MTNAAIIDTTDETNTNLPRYRKAYTDLLPEIRAVPVDDYVPVNLDPTTIVYTIEGVLPRLAPYRASIVEELPKFPIQYFDQLEQYALALGHAHTAYSNSMKASPILQALAEKGTPMREILVAEATTLMKRGLLPNNLLDNLLGPHGYKNLAADLFLVADKLRSNFNSISKRTSLTLAELDEAENLADQMNHEIGLRQQSPEGQAQSARDRQASYTLAVKAYDQTRAALAYVRRDYGDAEEIAPSLYAGRNNSNAKKKDTTENKPTATTQPTGTQPSIETHVTGGSTTGTPAAALTPAAGNAATDTSAEAAKNTTSTEHTVADYGPFIR